jgi:hypothetical protein
MYTDMLQKANMIQIHAHIWFICICIYIYMQNVEVWKLQWSNAQMHKCKVLIVGLKWMHIPNIWIFLKINYNIYGKT